MLQKIEELGGMLEFAEASKPQGHPNVVLQSCFYSLDHLNQSLASRGKPSLNAHIKRAEKENSCSKNLMSTSQLIYQQTEAGLSSILPAGDKSHMPAADRSVSQLLKQTCFSSHNMRHQKIGKILCSPLQLSERSQIQKYGLHDRHLRNDRKFFRIKPKKQRKPAFALSPEQRYFESKQVQVTEDTVSRIGLYEASNIFKAKNVERLMQKGYGEKLKPVINLRFANFQKCSTKQLFLNQKSGLPIWNLPDQYDISALSGKQEDQNHMQSDLSSSNTHSPTIAVEGTDQIEEGNGKKSEEKPIHEKHCCMVTVNNYEVEKNTQFQVFKAHNCEDWREIKLALCQVEDYLRHNKISHFSFKFDKGVFMREIWTGAKVKTAVLERLLKAKFDWRANASVQKQRQTLKVANNYTDKESLLKQVAKMWIDRRCLLVRKKKIKARNLIVQRLCLRMLTKFKIKRAKAQRYSKIVAMNRRLRDGEWQPEVEIYLPSFSESHFIRTTTQYMEAYESMFYHIWNSRCREVVLVLGAANTDLLKLLQERMKIQKQITIVCPDTHSIFPKSLPLATLLLFCMPAISRIRNILRGRRGVIVPGRFQQLQPEMSELALSELLMTPLLCNLETQSGVLHDKLLFDHYEIPTLYSGCIQKGSTFGDLVRQLSTLITDRPKVKKWVLKIDGEFNGRGIATFDSLSSRKLREILNIDSAVAQCPDSHARVWIKQETSIMVAQYLQTNFRLKLKVNFQNCIYRVEEFITQFLARGGVIEEHIEECDTYELCYRISHNQSQLIAVAQNMEVSFVTKSSLFLPHIPPSLTLLSQSLTHIFAKHQYFGYLSVTVLISYQSSQCYATQIKPYMTLTNSMSQLLAQQITSSCTAELESQGDCSSKQQQAFLFVPAIVLTDIEEGVRVRIIEDLVMNSCSYDTLSNISEGCLQSGGSNLIKAIYLSVGMSLGLLVCGPLNSLKAIKKAGLECMQQVSQKTLTAKACRGKQETRDLYLFCDTIRALSKIRC